MPANLANRTTVGRTFRDLQLPWYMAERRKLHLPSCNHELLLGCSLPDLGVDVHGEEGAGAVEDGGQRAHERGHHY